MAWQSGSPRLAPYQKRQLSRDEFWFNENMPWCWSFPTGWHCLDGWCMCCRCWYIWVSMWPNVMGASRVAGVTWFITMPRKRRIVFPSHTRWLFFPCFITTVWKVWRRWGGRTTDVLINRHEVTVTIFFVHHLSNILRAGWSSKLFEFHCLLVQACCPKILWTSTLRDNCQAISARYDCYSWPWCVGELLLRSSGRHNDNQCTHLPSIEQIFRGWDWNGP